MTNEELAVLIKAGYTEYIPQLWEQVDKFIWLKANWCADAIDGRGGVTAEDLHQAGYLALLSAVDNFDPAKEYKFLTYLDKRLKTAFAEATGYRTKRQQLDPLQSACSLDAPLSDGEEDFSTLGDTIPDPAAELAFDDVAEMDNVQRLHDALEDAFATLPDDQRADIREVYYMGGRVVDRKTHSDALRALRRPEISRELRQYWRDIRGSQT